MLMSRGYLAPASYAVCGTLQFLRLDQPHGCSYSDHKLLWAQSHPTQQIGVGFHHPLRKPDEHKSLTTAAVATMMGVIDYAIDYFTPR